MRKKIIASIIITLLFIYITSPCFAFEPSSSIIYQGIDVSRWQGNINFSDVKRSGIDIVYMKASEGRSYIDPYFERNYTEAKNNNLKVGFYHYVTARTVSKAKEQAIFFANVISQKSPDCKLAMDFEDFGNLSNYEINEISKVFLETLKQETKEEVLIYSNTYSAKNIFDAELTKYPLWVAHYNVNKPIDNGKWQNWIGWQYTSTGKVPGISGYVDKNYFTKDILLKKVISIPIPENNAGNINQENIVFYTVKRGDTLSAISKKYNTSILDILAMNPNIKNPNLIYPGQRFKIITNTESNVAIYYIVKKGDTLTGISKKYKTTVKELVELNGIKNPNLIYPNQRLKIYENTTNQEIGGENSCGKILYKIKYGDTLSKLALKYKTSVVEIAKINNISNPNRIYAGNIIRIPNCR